MSGTGKSALIEELRRRGYAAYDADDDGFTSPLGHGGWGWRAELVRELFDAFESQLLFFAGCSDEQGLFDFDLKVLLAAPEAVIVERLQTRASNPYGRRKPELERFLRDLRTVEPVLRSSADLVVDATLPLAQVADRVIEKVARLRDRSATGSGDI